MKNYFTFTIVCQLRNSKELTTHINDAANAVIRNLDKMLNCLTNIYSPNVNFNLRHKKNDKDFHYNYVITTNSVVDTEIDYHSLAKLIYDITFRAIKSIDGTFEKQPIYITANDLNKIKDITMQPLTEEGYHTMQAQIEMMLRSLRRQSTYITVLLFQSNLNDQTAIQKTSPTKLPAGQQVRPPQPTLFGGENNNALSNNDDIGGLPQKLQHTECIENLTVTCIARYNKNDELIIEYYINDQRVNLTFCHEVYEQQLTIVNDMLSSRVTMAVDINFNDDGRMKVFSVEPEEQEE